MALQLGDEAPDFVAPTTHGRIVFHEWLNGRWAVLFSHPRDFTPVCTTELGEVARLRRQFDQRGVKIIGLSVDTVQAHEQWARDIRDVKGAVVDFPVISDLDRSIARRYGMLHPQHDELFTVRSVFVIDPQRRIRLTMTYPQSCGRNFDEILRVLDSLQRTDESAIATPANWRVGEDVIVLPTLDDEAARKRFPAGWRAPKPYLRWVADPRLA
jgi:alkyl hydroperoxide reductase subunit AhpC